MDNRTVEVFIEIPQGSRNKYEYDEARKLIKLDRVLYSSVHYPTDYGFVVGKRAADGDPLDALVIVNEPAFPGCLVPVRPIGVLEMVDEHGLDYKILGVPACDPRFAEIHNLKDLAPHWLREIENFFDSYKKLEGKPAEVKGWHDVQRAWEVIDSAGPAPEPGRPDTHRLQ